MILLAMVTVVVLAACGLMTDELLAMIAVLAATLTAKDG